MNLGGYDPDRFVGGGHEAFQCPICIQVVLEPYECHSCGKLFCKSCITSWATKQADNKCPNRCGSNITNIKPIFSKALQRMYVNLNIKCINQKCGKTFSLGELPKHEAVCMVTKCWNFDNCQKPQNKEIKSLKPCCSELCDYVLKIVERFGDKKAMYELLGKVVSSPISQVATHSGGKDRSVSIGANGSPIIAWDSSKTGGSIQLSDSNSVCFLKEQSYLFRTTIANYGFTSGIHYWEIVADPRTENQLKIGVSLSNTFDFNSAFCDHAFGFAYYGLGQLRHGSNAAGPAYGKKFKKDGVLGVFLNMTTGVLAFSLNGEYMGVAYRDPKLTVGPVYPAVALLHCAGCKLRSGLKVPSYFKD